MNKSRLTSLVASQVSLPKATDDSVVAAVFSTIGDALARGDNVAIAAFGTFTARIRAARQGRNPRTGENIDIAASTVPSFKPGKTLRDTVRNRTAQKKSMHRRKVNAFGEAPWDRIRAPAARRHLSRCSHVRQPMPATRMIRHILLSLDQEPLQTRASLGTLGTQPRYHIISKTTHIVYRHIGQFFLQ